MNANKVNELHEKLAEVNARIERHHATQLTGAQTNPDNEIGGIRSRSKRQKERILSRFASDANKAVKLYRERDEIEANLRAAIAEPVRKKADQLQAELVTALKPGDMVWCGFPDPKEVVRVNKNSVSVKVSYGTERVDKKLVIPANL